MFLKDTFYTIFIIFGLIFAALINIRKLNASKEKPNKIYIVTYAYWGVCVFVATVYNFASKYLNLKLNVNASFGYYIFQISILIGVCMLFAIAILKIRTKDVKNKWLWYIISYFTVILLLSGGYGLIKDFIR
jgi:hypothetical protein